MRVSGPLFKWFGSKWLSSRKYPAPLHDTLIEPFAGSAGYSLRHGDGRNVVLYESDAHLLRLWRWLIEEATEEDVRQIPIQVPEGTDIRTLGLTDGQQLLLKTWQRTNNVGDCWTISPWGNKPGQWTANTRARVAAEFEAVRGWKIFPEGLKSFTRPPTATWFVDPPYEFNYQYRSKSPVDYSKLGQIVAALPGQQIVCEAVCPKTGRVPAWLPFVRFEDRITSRRKSTNNHHSKELLWTSANAILAE